MNSSEYWKAVASNYVMLMITVLLFFSCMCTGLRGTESYTPTKLAVAASALIVGLLLTLLSVKMQQRGKASTLPWLCVAILGNALTIGGGVATVSPLIAVLAGLFKGVSGFGMCLFAWFVLSLLIGVSCGIFVGMLKSAFESLRSLDFTGVIIALMVALAGLYGIIPCINVAMSISPLVGFGCFLALVGGGGLGYTSPTVSSDSVVYDAQGNPHYIVGRVGPERVTCTDGFTWRREADGHFSQIN